MTDTCNVYNLKAYGVVSSKSLRTKVSEGKLLKRVRPDLKFGQAFRVVLKQILSFTVGSRNPCDEKVMAQISSQSLLSTHDSGVLNK